MVTERRAETAKDKRNSRKWVTWSIWVIVALCIGVVIWQSGIWRDESTAKLEALIEANKQDRAALEELRAKVEELLESNARIAQQNATLEELRATRDELRAKLEELQAE